MSDSCLEKNEEIITLEGYSYRLWEYQASLSQLTIRAHHPNKPKHNIHIVFQGVAYRQMPISWSTGDFRLGPRAELSKIAGKAGLTGFDPGSFFKADTPNGPVYVLGTVVAILRDVEPLY